MNLKRKLVAYVKFCLILVFLALFTNQFIGYFCDVKGNSMFPTLSNGDGLIISKTSYYFHEPERFDIITFRYRDSLLIKRIIGLPGDQIFFKNDRLYVNGKWVKEWFLTDSVTQEEGNFTEDFMLKEKTFFQTVPPNSYFVLGDNRPNSVDSRAFGFISKNSIQGKAVIRWSPFEDFTWSMDQTVRAEE